MTNPSTENCEVLFEEHTAAEGKFGVVTLNASATLNSLTLNMVQAMSEQLHAWQNDASIHAILLTGTGERAFCAGGDVQQLYHSAIETPGGPCTYAEAFFLHEYALDYLIHTYTKPVICLGHGIVMGGGLGLMAGATFRVATPSTRIAMPEITIGLFPDVGGTYFLNKMPHGLGHFFALSGANINANDALLLGLATHVTADISAAELIAALEGMAFSSDATENSALIAAALDTMQLDTGARNQAIPSEIGPVLNPLQQACRQTSLGEMLAAFHALEAQSAWLGKAVKSIAHGSPLSALIIYEQLRRHQYSDLKTVFISEYQLACNVVRYPEFAEGVRALLIDKDKSPAWQFTHFSHVPASVLERFFTPPWPDNPLTALLD